MDIEHDSDVRLERDGDAIRQVLHLARPFTAHPAHSPRALALLYLHVHAGPFHLDRSALPSVPGMPWLPFWVWPARLLRAIPLLGPLLWPWLTDGIRLNPEPRLVTIRDRESVAVIFQQMLRVKLSPGHRDYPIRGAGIRVMVALSPLRVTGVYSTLRPETPPVIRSQPLATTVDAVAAELDIPLATIEGLFVDRRPGPGDTLASDLTPIAVYGRVQDIGLGPLDEGRGLPYREHVDLESGAVIRREAHASHANGVTGLVFPIDPPSQVGGPPPPPPPAAPTTNRPSDELDPFLRRLPLPGLVPPSAGAQPLQGQRVVVAPDNPLGIAPPTRPPGANFDFHARTDDFAAVSAYRHCDAAVRMIEAVGFPPATYFADNVAAGRFPLRVVHRAPIWPGPAVYDGRTVNAQVVGDGLGNPSVVGELRFALADLSDMGTRPPAPTIAPLGIASDARFVWHELCHALLIASTGTPEFLFAHSAGDALAAVICDLDSRVGELAPPWRGVTFPWVEALRRHDRLATEGWAWHGSLYSPVRDMRDPAGYLGEQVLSSTLFLLYRALGGDAVQGNTTIPDLAARRRAAAYTAYLIVAAIRSLGPAATVPALDAYALAGALMTTDVATGFLFPDGALFPPFLGLGRRGGAVHKVVRWCFEQQGLYAPLAGSRPWDAVGQPEPVDVYIEDGRTGGYGYTAQWHSAAPHLRAAAVPNAGNPDAPPHAGVPSFVFVRVANRGPAPNPPPTTVRVFAARAPSGLPRWRLAPGPFNQWVEQAPNAGAVTTARVAPGAVVDFGPFVWQPGVLGPHGLLACIDGPGDRCNALQPTYACAVGPTRLADLVPFDNNLGYRGIAVLP